MPGIHRIELICDERFGTEITAEAIRQLRADIFSASAMELNAADRLSLDEAADILDGKGKARTVVRAGEAFLRAMENDPDAKAALQHAHDRMHAFVKAMQEAMASPEYRAAQEVERQRWQELADAIRQAVEAAGDELESRHFVRPETIEDWEHLARIVEIPAETIKTGNLTAREIFACALAWADRQTIKTKLAAETNTAGGQGEPEPADEPGPESPTGFLGGAALADALGVHATQRDAFFQRLMRQRMSLGDECWCEVRDPRRHSPRYLYWVDSPKIRDLAAGYKTPKPA